MIYENGQNEDVLVFTNQERLLGHIEIYHRSERYEMWVFISDDEKGNCGASSKRSLRKMIGRKYR